MCFSPVLVNEVDAERVGGQLHQAIHGYIKVTVTRRLTGPQSQTIVHQTACIPANTQLFLVTTQICSLLSSSLTFVFTFSFQKLHCLFFFLQRSLSPTLQLLRVWKHLQYIQTELIYPSQRKEKNTNHMLWLSSTLEHLFTSTFFFGFYSKIFKQTL